MPFSEPVLSDTKCAKRLHVVAGNNTPDEQGVEGEEANAQVRRSETDPVFINIGRGYVVYCIMIFSFCERCLICCEEDW